MVTGPLEGLRVVELGGGIGPAYAGKLFADAGADVWLVEPPGGDPLRRWSASGADLRGHEGALFRFLAASKHSVVGGLDQPDVVDLIAGADLVLEALAPGVVEAAGLIGRPGLVVTSMSPFGRGPWQDRPASELTIQAECGSLAARVHPEGPLQAGGRLTDWAAGVFAAPISLAAVRHVRAGGAAPHIDLSMNEVMCICTNLFADLLMDMLGRPEAGPLGAGGGFPAIEATGNGWVGFNTNSAQMFEDFLVLVGRTDLSGIPGLRQDPEARADLERSTHEWCMAHTTEEIVELAALLRVPAVPVGNGEVLPRNPHLVARRTYAHSEREGFTYPRPPYRLNGQFRPEIGPWPALGADQDRIPAPEHPRPPAAPNTGLPMAGLRVLDMTCWWAGPAATQLMAGLGADVIHVEAVQRMDGMRPATTFAFADRDRWWEYSAFFIPVNTNKRGITLNLEDPDGLELARRLVGWADVVVENFTPRVMERFGLDAVGMAAINPTAVIVRMPAFGLDGPWRDRVGFAQTMEAMSGLAWVTGVPEGPPRLPTGPCDPMGGMHAAFAIQVALAERERTGQGQVVEASLLESGLNVAAEQVIEYSAYGALLTRQGNRTPGVAPQGVFACQGEQRWLALSVMDDRQWAGLRDALGHPDWLADPKLDVLAGREAAQDELEAGLAAWAADQDLEEAVERLLAHGVPAAAVFDYRMVSRHPAMAARGFFEVLDHPVAGSHPMFGLPFRYTGIDRWWRTPGPTLGQHNSEVLRTILGLSEQEIADLEQRHIIGTAPL